MSPRRLLVLSAIAVITATTAPGRPAARGAEPVSPTSPRDALAALTLPEGFRATLFAAEPMVSQPIGITTDARGRLWVCENETYSDQTVNFDLKRHDRIVILEDTDHDGHADRRTVFWDRAQRLTSVAVGFGGVWALCPPQLVFLADRDGDDVPDGDPEIVLDGWDADTVRHNIANGLRWGPDGWLYGRHGIQATSRVGRPGTPPERRTALNCCVWRYHPTRKSFEVVCRGTTNSWGMDWDQDGQLFFINTVIGHLWHAVPGAHFQRMYGEDFDPHLYRLMGQTADHFHWDTREAWMDIRKTGVTPTTDVAGGGHAHSGMMIYQGDNWPKAYRGSLFTVNLHGRRLNRDTLERRGAGYVGHHAPDFLRSSDPWFRAVELISGQDGGVYLADWSDVGECHENDGVHRASGRIFKITHGTPARPAVADVAALGDLELARLLTHQDIWYVRAALLALQERAAAGRPMGGVHDGLRQLYERDSRGVVSLRALWGLYVTGGARESWLLKVMGHPYDQVRAWSVRLLVDADVPTPEVLRIFREKAEGDRSGLVLLYLASALQRIPVADRWPIAHALAMRQGYADDPMLPLLVWYGIEPAVAASPDRALVLAGFGAMPVHSRLIARRLTEELAKNPHAIDGLVALVGSTRAVDRRREILGGMSEALRGWRKAPVAAGWELARATLAASGDAEVARLVRELSVVFGDGRALDELRRIATSATADTNARRDALNALVEARAEGLVPVLRGLIDERDLGPDAVRGLAAFDDPGTARLLVQAYRRLRPAARAEAIVALAARPASARALLQSVADGVIDRRQVSPFQVRQMLAFPDDDIRRRAAELWPELKPISAAKRERIAQLKARLDPSTLARADAVKGRGLFTKTCASCHVLFGEGGKIGPELTGAQRSSLDYLLENIVDPSATLAADYRMSTVALRDGRILDGLVSSQTGPTLALQTPTERLVLNRSDVEEIRPTTRSLMPEGLLDVLGEDELRDLVAYLMSPVQVPSAGADAR